MRRAPSWPHWHPVPKHERQRLVTTAHLALHELRAGRPYQAVVDLQAIVVVCQALLAGDRFTEDARQAVQEAAGALESVEAGTAPPEAAAGACEALVLVFEALLRTVTHRRLVDAQDRAATVFPPCP